MLFGMARGTRASFAGQPAWVLYPQMKVDVRVALAIQIPQLELAI